MDVSSALIPLLVLASMVAASTAMSISSEIDNSQMEDEDQKDYSKRASWMQSRQLEDQFVDLVDMAIHKLAAEGRLNSELLPQTNGVKQKRGRFQGFCFRKTSSGRFLPYVCWKSDRRRK